MEVAIAFAAFILMIGSWTVIGRRLPESPRVAARSLTREDAA